MASPRSAFRTLPAAALLAAVLAFAHAGLAESASGASSAGASIDFKVVIPVVLRARTVSQAPQLSIAASDLARGYVDVERATRLRVTSNNPSGFMISVTFDPALVARVEARVAGQSVQAASPGTSVQVQAAKLDDATLDVGYRLFLVPGTRPGTYAWPVTLALGAGA